MDWVKEEMEVRIKEKQQKDLRVLRENLKGQIKYDIILFKIQLGIGSC